jgi:hypothetical protein
MNKCLYSIEPKTAEVLFYFIEVALIAVVVERVIGGNWRAATIFAVIAVACAIFRFVKGPLAGPALVEVTESELLCRSFFYFPTKVQKNKLDTIKAFKIVGARGDRRFRISLLDGSEEEFRPYYGPLVEPKVINFLRNSLPKSMALVEEDPPSVLSRMRGDY